MPTLSSMAAPEVVIMTTSGAANDDKVGIMITVVSEWSFYEQIILVIMTTSGAANDDKVGIMITVVSE